MELPDTHGDDPSITALEGYAGSIAGKIFGLKATVAFKVTPCADGSRRYHARGEEKGEEEEEAHVA
jgi:hypothetical protein